MYCSTALLMKVLRGISPRALSACFSNDTGNVIPTFSVLSFPVVPIILVLYVVPQSYKHIVCHMYFSSRNILFSRFGLSILGLRCMLCFSCIAGGTYR